MLCCSQLPFFPKMRVREKSNAILTGSAAHVDGHELRPSRASKQKKGPAEAGPSQDSSLAERKLDSQVHLVALPIHEEQ